MTTATDTTDIRELVAAFTDRVRSAGHLNPAVLREATPQQLEHVASGGIVRDLARVVAFESTRAGAEGSDEMDIEGYGAVFDSETEINSFEGKFLERIRKGAFKKSLREVGIPKMQFDHGHHPLLGSLPLGRWHEAKEDNRGLFLRGRMYDDWLFTPFRTAIRDGGIDGMSFRFSVVREKWTDIKGKQIADEHELFELLFFGAGDRGPITRELIEVRAQEAGPVMWPAYKDTTVSARSDDDSDGSRIVIDLHSLGSADGVRNVATAIARLDAVANRITRDEKMAALLRADSALADAGCNTDADDPAPADSNRTDVDPTSEPRSTEAPADGHPAADSSAAAPPATDATSAGQHSSSQKPTRQLPLNPTERADQMRKMYRSVVDRVLALPSP